MRAEFHIDPQAVIAAMREVLLKELQPLLEKRTAASETLFTVKTLAKYLHVSDQWVYERVHLQEIPCIKVGKFPRFKPSDIDRWLETLKRPALSPLSPAQTTKLLKARTKHH